MAPPERSQVRQEGLGHAEGAEEVDGEVAFEHGTIAQVVVERDASVVDEDVERADYPGSFLDLRRAGHVQGQRGDALVWVGQRHTRAGIHPLRVPAKRFFDQRLADAAVGSGHQDCLFCDDHVCSFGCGV